MLNSLSVGFLHDLLIVWLELVYIIFLSDLFVWKLNEINIFLLAFNFILCKTGEYKLTVSHYIDSR